jgi:magnesium transporter
MGEREGAMLVGCAAYEDGKRIADFTIEEVPGFRRGKGRFVWIGLHEPSEELLRKVQRLFGLHDLAIEDAHNAHQRPKLEVYDSSLFLVLHTAQLINGAVELGETHIFVGDGYVITVRHGPSSSYTEVRGRCESAPALLRKGEDFVLYSLIDFIVDNYMPVVETIELEVEALEQSVFKDTFDRSTIERVYDLKRDLVSLRRSVAPLADITTRLMRFDVSLIDRDTHPYFRDVHDHVVRIAEAIDNLRELLTSALEANLMLASVQQNEVTKRLAGWAAILAVPTAVAGIYGMNFRYMPELDWALGYPVTLLGIALVCGYLYYRFRRAGWL